MARIIPAMSAVNDFSKNVKVHCVPFLACIAHTASERIYITELPNRKSKLYNQHIHADGGSSGQLD